MLGEIVKYATSGRGLLRASATEVGGFLRTSPDHDIPDVQYHGVPVLFDDSGRDLGLLARTGYSLHVCVLRPKSQGQLTLASADPRAAPVIDNRALSHPDDVRSLVAGVRIARKWLAAPSFTPYRKREIVPGAAARSDEEIEQACRDHLLIAYHPVGTCKMGRDEMAVVDSGLKVRGIEGLRVVDASIMPTLIGGNTNAPTIMIAEKAADLIRAERA
jgi:choline dehydrogenase-like flavoprotein